MQNIPDTSFPQLVHTHAKFKCTKTDLRLTELSPRFCFIEHGRDKTHQPTTCMSVCRRVCESHHQHTCTNTHKHTRTVMFPPVVMMR